VCEKGRPCAEQHRPRSIARGEEQHCVEGLVRQLREQDEQEARKQWKRIHLDADRGRIWKFLLGIIAGPTQSDGNWNGAAMRLGAGEILVVLGLALLFFGPSKLPALGASLGEAIRGFKRGLTSADPKPEKPALEPPGRQ